MHISFSIKDKRPQHVKCCRMFSFKLFKIQTEHLLYLKTTMHLFALIYHDASIICINTFLDTPGHCTMLIIQKIKTSRHKWGGKKAKSLCVYSE